MEERDEEYIGIKFNNQEYIPQEVKYNKFHDEFSPIAGMLISGAIIFTLFYIKYKFNL